VAHHRIESLNKAPSYKRIVKAILSNDVYLTSLGFSKPRCSAYDAIKYSELKDNGKIKQMDLFK
jgi:predicted phosphoadenosine phosphosulfate sulfurtransferase